MSFEERAEILRRSIELHDRQIAALGKRMDRMPAAADHQFAALDARLDRFVEATQLNFERLTQSMIGLKSG
jgi:hypothetical protein